VEFLGCIGVHIVFGQKQEEYLGNLNRIQLRADRLHVRLVLSTPRVIRYKGIVLRHIVVRLILFILVLFLMNPRALPMRLLTSGSS
jgi:hypothetical protein